MCCSPTEGRCTCVRCGLATSRSSRTFHARQSSESIYFRYFSARPTLSARELEHLTHVDYTDRMAFIGLIGDELVGIARYDRYPTSGVAEVAFFTDEAQRGRGMATVLLEYLAAAAREAGISGFVAQVLPQNHRMLSVFKQAGFEVHSHFEDGIIEVELGIEPTPEARAVIDERARLAFARSVHRMLAPSSIAVIGASRRPGSIGHQIVRRIIDGGLHRRCPPGEPPRRLDRQRARLLVGRGDPHRGRPGDRVRAGLRGSWGGHGVRGGARARAGRDQRRLRRVRAGGRASSSRRWSRSHTVTACA